MQWVSRINDIYTLENSDRQTVAWLWLDEGEKFWHVQFISRKVPIFLEVNNFNLAKKWVENKVMEDILCTG